jgi:steroid delta-isomerase-like uncharacterized protein
MMNSITETKGKGLALAIIKTLNSRSDEQIMAMYAHDYVGEDITGGKTRYGNESVRTWMQAIYTAFPNVLYELEEYVQNGDDLVLHWVAKGNHHGTFLKIPATGKPVAIAGISMLKMENGKVKSGKLIWDLAGVLRQMGLLPQMPQ